MRNGIKKSGTGERLTHVERSDSIEKDAMYDIRSYSNSESRETAMRYLGVAFICSAIGLAMPSNAIGQCEIFRAYGSQFDLLGDSVGVHGEWLVYTQRDTVQVMRWTGAAWVYHTALPFANTVRAVDVYGDVIVAGVLGDFAVHIFRFDGNAWGLETVLNSRWSPSLLGSRTLDLHDDVLITSDPLSEDADAWVYRYEAGQWGLEFASPFRFYAVATDGERFMLGNQFSFWIFGFDGLNWIEEYAWSPTHIGGERVDISGSVAIASRRPTTDDVGLLRIYRSCDGQPAPWCENVGLPIGIDGDIALMDDVRVELAGNQLELRRDDGTASWDSFDLLSGTGANDSFGKVVEIDADWIVVGAPFDNAGGDNAGAIYVFRRDATYVAPQVFAFELGTCSQPIDSIQQGLANLAPSKVMVVAAGTFPEAPMVLDAPVSMTAAGGVVRIE